MVLTRRAAKAAAEAAEAAKATASAEAAAAAADEAADAEMEARRVAAAEATPEVGQESEDEGEGEEDGGGDAGAADEAAQREFHHDAYDVNATPSSVFQKVGRQALGAAGNARLKVGMYGGHICALFAVVVAAHAASGGCADGCPVHALLLLLCSVPLRTAIVFKMTEVSRLSLGLIAPVLFASNALHVLACCVDVSRIKLLLAAAATQVCADWLEMSILTLGFGDGVLVVPSFREPRFVRLCWFLDTCGDVFLAGVIAKLDGIVDLFYIGFVLRALVDVFRIVVSCVTIIRRDERLKMNDNQSAKQSTLTSS